MAISIKRLLPVMYTSLPAFNLFPSLACNCRRLRVTHNHCMQVYINWATPLNIEWDAESAIWRIKKEMN